MRSRNVQATWEVVELETNKKITMSPMIKGQFTKDSTAMMGRMKDAVEKTSP